MAAVSVVVNYLAKLSVENRTFRYLKCFLSLRMVNLGRVDVSTLRDGHLIDKSYDGYKI